MLRSGVWAVVIVSLVACRGARLSERPVEEPEDGEVYEESLAALGVRARTALTPYAPAQQLPPPNIARLMQDAAVAGSSGLSARDWTARLVLATNQKFRLEARSKKGEVSVVLQGEWSRADRSIRLVVGSTAYTLKPGGSGRLLKMPALIAAADAEYGHRFSIPSVLRRRE